MLFPVRSARLAFYALAILSFTCPYSYSQPPDQKQVFAREDAYVAEEMVMHHFRGAVLVGIDGKIVFEKAYGPADEEWDVPNTPKTKFRIASLTKQFSAACILILQERGLLHVQDVASKYLPNLPAAWKGVTIHQLLTHTAGIPNADHSGQQSVKMGDRIAATPEEMIAGVASKPLDFTPGTKWSYSNNGYILLGMLIEKVSGQSYADFLKSDILRPARHEGLRL
ncbi:MAG TPA: serine hydrolase domain-containing protein [Terriglobales bacterium]|nr:serine hydrolase domain-containing protein [Terriglobales bacterium]